MSDESEFLKMKQYKYKLQKSYTTGYLKNPGKSYGSQHLEDRHTQYDMQMADLSNSLLINNQRSCSPELYEMKKLRSSGQLNLNLQPLRSVQPVRKSESPSKCQMPYSDLAVQYDKLLNRSAKRPAYHPMVTLIKQNDLLGELVSQKTYLNK